MTHRRPLPLMLCALAALGWILPPAALAGERVGTPYRGPEELTTGRRQLARSPNAGVARITVEAHNIELAQSRPVVIACQTYVRQVTQLFDTIVGIRTITDQVA